MKLEMLRSLQNAHRAALALQAVRAKIRGKLPGRGRFKIMDESTAGSDSDSAPPSSRRGSQPKGVIFAEAVHGKTGSLDGRCGIVSTIPENVMSFPGMGLCRWEGYLCCHLAPARLISRMSICSASYAMP